MDNNLISNKELIEMGYRPHTANDIIHQEKLLLIIAVLKQKNLQSQKLNRFCKNFV